MDGDDRLHYTEKRFNGIPLSKEAYQRWEQKRKQTVIAFSIQSVLLGMDYNLTFLTLWAYLQQMEVKNDKEYYSLVAVSYLLVPVFFSVLICWIADQYRNVRCMFFISNTAMIIGNLLYSLPFSPWCLVVGRVIAGIAIPLRSVMAGELARCYHNEDLTSMFSLIGMSFGFGFVAGPGINFAFNNLDVYITGNWRVTYANVTGIYTAMFFLFAQVMCYFMVHDLSKEYDLKAKVQKENKHFREYLQSSVCSIIGNSFNYTLCVNTKEENYTSSSNIEIASEVNTVDKNGEFEYSIEYSEYSTTESIALPLINETTALLSIESTPNLTIVLKKMITNPDTLIMLILAFFENYFSISFNMWIPMAVMTTLNWSITALNGIVLGTGVCSIIPCTLLIFKKLSDRQLFFISTICVGLLACITSVFIALAFYTSNVSVNIFLWIVYCICLSNILIIKDIFLGGFLAKMLSSRIQASGDSLRLSSQRVGAITALLLSPTLYAYMRIVGFVYIFIVILLLVIMILRRKTLSEPRVVIDF